VSQDSRSALQGVNVEPLVPGSKFPLCIEPRTSMTDPVEWARAHGSAVDELVLEFGAILFRHFLVQGATQFQSFIDALCQRDWVEYREASTPRASVSGHVSTSTEYPADLRIYVHNENSHVTSWPLYLFFHCQRPADEWGHTPLADCRRVREAIPHALFEKFSQLGWMYRRNFVQASSFSWQKAYGVGSRSDLERYCAENHMLPEWKGDALTVKYRRWATVRHPLTRELLWFNHGTFFNPHSLEPGLRNAVLAMGEDRMPFNTYYGDGSAIGGETIRELDAAYSAATVSFPWQAGDVLMLDNMLMAHGRTPYKGRREVLVAMKHRVRCSEVATLDQYCIPPGSAKLS
jgi:alpha-ketoglutarate-dependent taurine dioxygenase